ncbi:peptide chain release factor 1 [Propionimicrobium sp. PCR01-08-3]|uniref:peptide chain release factor 1 n=1 Tax=Propionimicrobium sp. PCR01-08-3 TaxID=3052086 RepID=UPI00255C9DB3|nr:peptide chain release factor 1 [Propionimicrobium sp. PCR01-08-3]WIY83810.1 peptide chain release factor 1 [Propionimicrobium sp. PCR01-08-3]
MFEAAESMRAEYADVEQQMSDPAVLGDVKRSRSVGRRYAELGQIIKTLDDYDQLAADEQAARELAAEDPSFAGEQQTIAEQLEAVTEKLTALLAPRDPNDDCDAIMEIKSGEGGEESALFAADLLNMYVRYCEQRGFKVQILDSESTDLGGFKSVTAAIKASKNPEPGQAPYGVLKFEGGVHRVQRVPVTESQGRVHTSAAGVLVMPDVDDDEIEINEDDLRIDVYRSSGKGGQGVNTTDSAVRITHLPSGIVVTCQDERSQLQNKEQALRILRARLVAKAEEEQAQQQAAARKSQVRTVDRSERIRTYNFPENRIADHRIGFKAHNLDQVLAGDLEPLISALQAADLEERLSHVGEKADQ